ncbi:tyrosine-protein phosphatase non-receptor type 1 [Parasteatoda tepidariorum]|uniref:tyrosine-protein phosphatase non-receptor type 1 n=1 Tax=Parasteatoda tepidariorum TaxID=114398 RepID=UPI00077FDDCE|nr:tyrosine-protein phosphatase non-receptor type 1 [Parasteatoda tepidariorum]
MEVEFLDIDRRNAWNSIFQEIRNESNNFTYIIKDAKKMENKNLNRYRDVNPFDHSRVRLQRNGIDYINASLVNVESAERSYILTQGPLPLTIGHFWLMIWEQGSKGILMLNRVIEKNAVKCHQYWPVGQENGGSDSLVLNDVNLQITILSEKDLPHYSIRKFSLTDLESSQSREVIQFHYTTWPDFGVPESPAAFLSFLFAVRDSGVLNNNVGPPVVHCSAGIGRSGTFCLVDSCLVLIEKKRDPNCINARQQLLEMRHYRMGLIQTPDQLRFSYLAIIEGAKIVLALEQPSRFMLNNENLAQIHDNLSDQMENSRSYSNEIDSESGVLPPPPPLPPRISRSSDDISSIDYVLDSFLEKCDELINSESDITNSGLNAEQNANSLVSNHQSYNEPKINKQEIIPETSDGTEAQSADSTGKENLSEVRKRARKEREEKTASIVQNIKKKQKEADLWDKRKSLIKISIGLVFIIGLGYYAYKIYSKS